MSKHERTNSQVLVSHGIDGVLGKSQPYDWNKKVREMRRDPTIAFVRDIFLAPLLSADWTVVSDDPKYKSAEQDLLNNFLPRRHAMMRDIMRGLFDFGWQGFETVWKYNEETKLVELGKMKPLLQDITEILVDPYGDIRGLRNKPAYLGNIFFQNQYSRVGPWVDLNHDECFVVYRDAEGTNWYGEPIMRRVEEPYDSWQECEAAAKRFDTKIAGAHWVVYYPEGSSRYKGQESVDNFVIAQDVLRAMEASGRIAVPRHMLKQVDDLNSLGEDQTGWKIELISVSGTSESSFVGRQRYQDSLKARGFSVPERAVLEGQFGTKAEAEAHADFAIDNIQMTQVDIMDQINAWPVKFMLTVNHGREFCDHVRMQASPLSDVKKAQLRALYMQYFQSQIGAQEEADRIDWAAIVDELGLPVRDDDPNAVDGPGTAPADPASGATPADDPTGDQAAAAGLGEYTTLNQRQWTNNLKRIRRVLDEVTAGTMGRLLAQQTLYSIGVPTHRANALLDEAETGGKVDDEEIVAPAVAPIMAS